MATPFGSTVRCMVIGMRARFGPFTFDSDVRRLQEDGRDVHLSPKAFDLLCLLLEAAPHVVGKEPLMERIWPGTFVVETNLNVLVAEVRRALGDSASAPHYIRTVHGRGFAFAAPIVSLDAAAGGDATGIWLVGESRRFALGDGETLVGRDPRCAVWLDEPGISRQHARLRVDTGAGTALLEDLGSKNGTFVARRRIDTPTSLHDGDRIQFGDVALTYRRWTDHPTATIRRRRSP